MRGVSTTSLIPAETAARVTKLVDVVGRKDLAGKPGGIHPKRGR